MSGAKVEFDIGQLAGLNISLVNLADVDLDSLLESLAFEGEAQTRRRLSEEKESPDGDAWPEWSDRYAAKRHGGHSLLENEGDLIDSLESGTENNSAFWGSDLIYFATHQYGDPDRNIEQRESLGFSAENKSDLVAVMNDFLQRHIDGSVR